VANLLPQSKTETHTITTQMAKETSLH